MSYPGTTQIITLYSPLTLQDGSQLEEVTMREPLVRDRLAFSKDRGTDQEKEIHMLTSLCGLNEPDMLSLTSADYIQILDTFNAFMLPPAKRPKQTSKAA